MRTMRASDMPNRWITPPECQGQMVEVSYGSSCDGLGWRREYDQSDRSTLYSVCDMADCGCPDECDCWDPINSVPTKFHFEPVEIYWDESR